MFPLLMLGNQHRGIDLEREQSCGGADHDADRAADAARSEAGELTCTRGHFFSEEHSGTHSLQTAFLLERERERIQTNFRGTVPLVMVRIRRPFTWSSCESV
jgi:hypothetical protein